jgi:hypothetical protein
MATYQQIKPLLKALDNIQQTLYSFFYKLKAPKVGYYLGTPFYALQILLLDKTN